MNDRIAYLVTVGIEDRIIERGVCIQDEEALCDRTALRSAIIRIEGTQTPRSAIIRIEGTQTPEK
jgi:hypothetical protein